MRSQHVYDPKIEFSRLFLDALIECQEKNGLTLERVLLVDWLVAPRSKSFFGTSYASFVNPFLVENLPVLGLLPSTVVVSSSATDSS